MRRGGWHRPPPRPPSRLAEAPARSAGKGRRRPRRTRSRARSRRRADSSLEQLDAGTHDLVADAVAGEDRNSEFVHIHLQPPGPTSSHRSDNVYVINSLSSSLRARTGAYVPKTRCSSSICSSVSTWCGRPSSAKNRRDVSSSFLPRPPQCRDPGQPPPVRGWRAARRDGASPTVRSTSRRRLARPAVRHARDAPDPHDQVRVSAGSTSSAGRSLRQRGPPHTSSGDARQHDRAAGRHTSPCAARPLSSAERRRRDVPPHPVC